MTSNDLEPSKRIAYAIIGNQEVIRYGCNVCILT